MDRKLLRAINPHSGYLKAMALGVATIACALSLRRVCLSYAGAKASLTLLFAAARFLGVLTMAVLLVLATMTYLQVRIVVTLYRLYQADNDFLNNHNSQLLTHSKQTNQ